MRKTTFFCCLLAGCLTLVQRAPAQASDETAKSSDAAKPAEPPVHFYKLDIAIVQVDENGKPYNSRSFSTMVSTGHNDNNASTRTGARIPVATGSASSDPREAQYTYEEVGINLDTRSPREVGGKLTLYLVAEISSLADPKEFNGLSRPIMNHNKWQGQVLIPIGKATTVFSSDDMRNKGSMRMVVTATLLQ